MMASNEDSNLPIYCPVCELLLSEPPCNCPTGCRLCYEFFCRVKQCPKCGPKYQHKTYVPPPKPPKQEYKCQFSEKGCKYVKENPYMRDHEKYCRYAAKCCPFREYTNCSWRGIFYDLKVHLMGNHAANFFMKDKQRFIASKFKDINEYLCACLIIYAFNEFFKISWDVTPLTGKTRWAVYYIGTPAIAKKYFYKLEFTKGSAINYPFGSSLVFKSPCESATTNLTMRFVNKKYFSVHKSVLDEYCDPSGDLNYKVAVCVADQKYDMGSENARLLEPVQVTELYR